MTNYRQIVEECARHVRLHAASMREEKVTLTDNGVDSIADELLSRFDYDGFGLAAACSVHEPVAWQPIKTAPITPEHNPPLVMLWVEDGGHGGTGCHAFGHCYRSYDGTVRGVASGFLGDWSIKYWQPLPGHPSLTGENKK